MLFREVIHEFHAFRHLLQPATGQMTILAGNVATPTVMRTATHPPENDILPRRYGTTHRPSSNIWVRDRLLVQEEQR